jgi:ubiquinone biosynthesis protein UbiJ
MEGHGTHPNSVTATLALHMTRTPRTALPRDDIAAFFADVAERGHEPLLNNATGTVGFEVTDDDRAERYFVKIDRGDLQVTSRETKADVKVFVDRALLEKLVQGKANGMSSLLRGTLRVAGDLGLVTKFLRLFPGPLASRRSFLARQKGQEE